MPGKPPYFPFYVNDFAADDVVEAMTTEQVGAYALLLCKAWMQTPAGTVPADDAILARWARVSARTWDRIKSGVLAAFALGQDGRYHQKRMEVEYAKLITTLEARSEGGRRSAEARRQQREAANLFASSVEAEPSAHLATELAAQLQLNGSTPPTRAFGSGSESGSDSDSPAVPPRGGGAGGGGPPGFAEFWAAYPRRTAKVKAVRAWRAIKPDASLLAVILAALDRQKASDQWRRGVVPHPATWLNQRRWDDELPGPATAGDGVDVAAFVLGGLRAEGLADGPG